MRWLVRRFAWLLVAASLSGCTFFEAELSNRGGFLDPAADEWMKADTKKMRALRAFAIEASLARIAMIAPKTAPDRAMLARRIGEASKRAELVRQCAFTRVIAGQRFGEPCFFFDSVMVDYENALFDLALISLPIDEARTLITRVSGGVAAVSLNPLQLVQALLDIGREAFRYGRVAGAIYRDTLELEVQVWLTSPEFANAERVRGLPEELIVTTDRVANLAAIYVRGNDNIPAWRAEIAVLRGQGLEPVPHERFFIEIYAILTYICGQIVSKEDPAYRECAIAPVGIAASTLPIRIGLGGGGGSGGTSGQASSSGQTSSGQTSSGQTSANSGSAVREEKIAGYKRALCVTGDDPPTNTMDGPQSKASLQAFAAGAGWKDAIALDSTPRLDLALQRKLDDAVKISQECSPTGFVSSAYELGVYARQGIQTAEIEIANALRCVGLPETLRGREAMKELRAKLVVSVQATTSAGQRCPPLPTTAVAADARTDLDPPLWNFILRKSVEFKRRATQGPR